MVKSYGLHRAQDCAIACNSLRRAVRELADDAPDGTDLVGLSLAAGVLDQVADALDRHWLITRPSVID